jgi:polyhydroxyalkanoate synthesis regulator phasin
MVDKPLPNDVTPAGPAEPAAAQRRAPGHRPMDTRDTVAEMAERAQIISQEAGTKVAAAMRDVISAAAGITGFAIESARDLTQYMVRRGQMTPEEAEKLIREAESAHDKRPASEKSKPTASAVAAERAAVAKAEAAARNAALASAQATAHATMKAAAKSAAASAASAAAAPKSAAAPAPAKAVARPAVPPPKPVAKAAPAKTAKSTKAAKPASRASAKPAAKSAKVAKSAKPAKKTNKR